MVTISMHPALAFWTQSPGARPHHSADLRSVHEDELIACLGYAINQGHAAAS